MKKPMKLGKFEDLLKREELKDPGFRRAYEQECRSIFLAYRINQLRTNQGMTQQELAKRMKTSQQAVARLESGVHEGFTLKTLERAAAALGADLFVDLRRRPGKPGARS